MPEILVRAQHDAAPGATTYTCPMHPEIRQPAPGNCPICGMALEPLMPSVDEDENPELAMSLSSVWVVANALRLRGGATAQARAAKEASDAS